MIFRSKRRGFWARRGIKSLEESSDDNQDQDLQGLPHQYSWPEIKARNPSRPTLYDPPPSEEEGRQ